MDVEATVVFLDACFSGTQRDGKMLLKSRGVAIKPKHEIPQGNVIVLSATTGDETAMPYTKQGHGIFTYYLLKKIKATQGNCSLGELNDYVFEEVSKQSIVVNGKPQTPTITTSFNLNNWKELKLK